MVKPRIRILRVCNLCRSAYVPTRGDRQKFCSISCGSKSRPSGRKGKKNGINQINAMRSRVGEKHPLWIKDRTKLKRTSKQGERRTSAYFYWRKSVWERDNWKCRINNEDCEGRIEAHHILSWTKYPELRYEINNGITLCHRHHPRRKVDEIDLIPTFRGMISLAN